MSELFIAMILVLLTWSYLILIFMGLGLFLCRAFGLKIQRVDGLFVSFWSGWALAIILLQLWHLFFRIDWKVLVLFASTGIIGLVWNRENIWYLVKEKFPKNWLFYFVLLLAAFWIANHAIGPVTKYDSGLYELTSVRWAASYPIVHGLGNLHGRLAFNNTHFLYVALLEIGPWIRKSHHLANGLLLLILFAQILLSGYRLLKSFKPFKDFEKVRVHDLFYILLFPAVFKLALNDGVSSPTPEFPLFILGIVLSSQLLIFLVNSDYSYKESNYTLLLIITLSVVGITIKLSFTALGLVTSLLALIMWTIRTGRQKRSERRRTFVWVIGCIAIVLIPWMVRGVILSGYVAYPSTAGSFPVEWRMPRESVVEESKWIRSWSRQSQLHWSEVLQNWDWFKPWANMVFKSQFKVVIPLVLTLMGCFLALFVRVRKKQDREQQKMYWLFLLPPVASLIFWFFTAPALVHASSTFWILGAGAVILFVSGFNELKRNTIIFVLFLLILCLFGIFERMEIRSRFIIGPTGNGRGFYPVRRVNVNRFKTHSGLVVYVPVKGDQCWGTPLPCTPYPNADLKLRKDGDISKGFMLDRRD